MGRKAKPEEETVERNYGARQAWMAVGILVVFGVTAQLLWSHYGGQILADRQVQISQTSLQVTQQPPWIRCDVCAEAFRDGSLSGLTIDMQDLNWRVAEAFSMHSWVQRVTYVTKKYPDIVVVKLVYRKPVAMVEVEDAAGNRGLFPVDRDGTLLPPDDFMPAANPAVSVEDFPRLRSDGLYPTSPPGRPWGDIRVQSGARLAELLTPFWKRFGLSEIVARRGPRVGTEPGPPTFELRTSGHTVVLWGHAPDAEVAGEATADKKIAQLADFLQQHGTLDAVAPDQTIDVRHLEGLEVATVGRQFR